MPLRLRDIMLVKVYYLDGGEEKTQGFCMDQIKDAIPSDLFRGRPTSCEWKYTHHV